MNETNDIIAREAVIRIMNYSSMDFHEYERQEHERKVEIIRSAIEKARQSDRDEAAQRSETPLAHSARLISESRTAAASGAASSEPQEWTPEYVDCRLLKQAQVPWKTVCAVADAHNAALAAEREKYQFKANLTQEIVIMRKELEGADKVITQLAQELAAEREKREPLGVWLSPADAINAAIDDARKPLVESIKEALGSSNPEQVLSAALAQLKE